MSVDPKQEFFAHVLPAGDHDGEIGCRMNPLPSLTPPLLSQSRRDTFCLSAKVGIHLVYPCQLRI